jgi:hypothetical protein
MAGQSQLIFGIGSTGCVTTSKLSKLCYTYSLYKPLENLDAIALGVRDLVQTEGAVVIPQL